jgi:lipopolysaccharide/colanic/teichoic acid biosynthesis glycosyltransferase
MDLAGSLAGLLVLAPFLLLTGCVIRLVSPGPALFRQQRVGVRGEPFTIWKFRTMRADTDSRRHQEYVAGMVGAEVPLKKLDDRHQLIPLGGLLRALCIDELPQLVNVLRGEMSLVGPRPDVIPYELYQPWQRRRFEVLPGITGLWQVSGKNQTTFAEMIHLDVQYVEQRSFWLDASILLMTVPTVICQRVSQPATEPPRRDAEFSLSGTASVSKE